jgi:hypothetical protein
MGVAIFDAALERRVGVLLDALVSSGDFLLRPASAGTTV